MNQSLPVDDSNLNSSTLDKGYNWSRAPKLVLSANAIFKPLVPCTAQIFFLSENFWFEALQIQPNFSSLRRIMFNIRDGETGN